MLKFLISGKWFDKHTIIEFENGATVELLESQKNAVYEVEIFNENDQSAAVFFNNSITGLINGATEIELNGNVFADYDVAFGLERSINVLNGTFSDEELEIMSEDLYSVEDETELVIKNETPIKLSVMRDFNLEFVAPNCATAIPITKFWQFEHVLQNFENVPIGALNTNSNEKFFSPKAQPKSKSAIKKIFEKDGLMLYFFRFMDLDFDLVLQAVSNNGLALEFVASVYKNNREIVVAAIKNNGSALQFASDNFKSNSDIVLEAIENNPQAISFADSSFIKNKNIAKKVVKMTNGDIEYLPKQYQDDPEILSAILEADGNRLQSLNDKIRNDRASVLRAVKGEASALKYASKSLQNDEEFLLEAISVNSDCFLYLKNNFKNDEQFLQRALFSFTEDNSWAQHNINSLPKKFLNNKEIIIKLVEINGLNLEYASKEIKQNRDVVLSAVKTDGRALWYAGNQFKKDKEIVKIAIKTSGLKNINTIDHYGREFQGIHEELLYDAEFMIELVGSDFISLIDVPSLLWKNKKFVLDVIKNSVNFTANDFNYVDDSLHDNEEVIQAGIQKGFIVEWGDGLFVIEENHLQASQRIKKLLSDKNKLAAFSYLFKWFDFDGDYERATLSIAFDDFYSEEEINDLIDNLLKEDFDEQIMYGLANELPKKLLKEIHRDVLGKFNTGIAGNFIKESESVNENSSFQYDVFGPLHLFYAISEKHLDLKKLWLEETGMDWENWLFYQYYLNLNNESEEE